MLVAISNVSPAFFGAAMNRRNSRDLLHRYFFPRQVISFKPLVDQFATVVNTAALEGRPRRFPKICHHGLSRGQPFESMQRNRKILCPDVFAECEKRVMPPQIFDCRFHAFVDLDLFNAGIALDVKNAVGNKQIVIELLRAANVQDGVSFAIQLPDSFQ